MNLSKESRLINLEKKEKVIEITLGSVELAKYQPCQQKKREYGFLYFWGNYRLISLFFEKGLVFNPCSPHKNFRVRGGNHLRAELTPLCLNRKAASFSRLLEVQPRFLKKLKHFFSSSGTKTILIYIRSNRVCIFKRNVFLLCLKGFYRISIFG